VDSLQKILDATRAPVHYVHKRCESCIRRTRRGRLVSTHEDLNEQRHAEQERTAIRSQNGVRRRPPSPRSVEYQNFPPRRSSATAMRSTRAPCLACRAHSQRRERCRLQQAANVKPAAGGRRLSRSIGFQRQLTRKDVSACD
jgi:hypothetical protein